MSGAREPSAPPDVRPSMPTPVATVDFRLEGAQRGGDGLGLAALALIGALAAAVAWLAWLALRHG